MSNLLQEGMAPTAGTSQIANLWDEFARGNYVFFVSGTWQMGELRRRLPPRRASWQGAPLALDPKVDAFRQQLERVESAPWVPGWERIQSEVTQIAERAARGLVNVAAAARELDHKSDRFRQDRWAWTHAPARVAGAIAEARSHRSQ